MEKANRTATPDLSIETIYRRVIERGNDVEIRRSKEGVKVFEVCKRLIAEIPNERKAETL